MGQIYRLGASNAGCRHEIGSFDGEGSKATMKAKASFAASHRASRILSFGFPRRGGTVRAMVVPFRKTLGPDPGS